MLSRRSFDGPPESWVGAYRPHDESPHADMISRVDWFHFAPTRVPTRLRGAKDAKLVPILARA